MVLFPLCHHMREKSMLSGEQMEIRDRYLEMGKRESKVKNQTGELFLEWNFKNRVRYWSDSEEKIQKKGNPKMTNRE